MNVCVIPARGGSKRIPRKNVKRFCGKPMITWSIEAALRSGCFEKVVVSTDDAEIIAVARQYGAEVPFTRPAELSGDHVATRPVVNHAIQEITKKWEKPDFVCCLYATAPFVKVEDIKAGIDILLSSGADFAFSVTTFQYPIQRALRITQKNRVTMFYPEHRLSRSQDLEEAYHDAGQFYWGRTDAFLANQPTFSEASVPIVLPRYRVQDIDSPEDWQQAELMFDALGLASQGGDK